MSEELKSCPFCGLIDFLEFSDGRITCKSCLGAFPIDWPTTEIWETASCWKEISRLTERVKELEKERDIASTKGAKP